MRSAQLSAYSPQCCGGAGGMLPQEKFDMRVLLRPSETAITTQLHGNWSVTQMSHRMVVSLTPLGIIATATSLVPRPSSKKERRV